MKLTNRVIISAIILFGVAINSSAVEIKPSPIQDQLKNSILLASDNWEIEDTEQKSNTTDSKNIRSSNKSTVKAILYSALLPGLGEHYVGNRKKARFFFATEALTWMSYLAFKTYGNWKKDDMIRYAADNANASLEGKDDEFLDWVGFYNSTDDFNSLGRVSDPERNYLTGVDNYWQWSTDASRESFREIKNSSRTAHDRANFMIMAAIGNRIISIIDAIRDSKKTKKSKAIDISGDKTYNYKLAFDPMSYNKQFSITVLTPF